MLFRSSEGKRDSEESLLGGGAGWEQDLLSPPSQLRASLPLQSRTDALGSSLLRDPSGREGLGAGGLLHTLTCSSLSLVPLETGWRWSLSADAPCPLAPSLD